MDLSLFKGGAFERHNFPAIERRAVVRRQSMGMNAAAQEFAAQAAFRACYAADETMRASAQKLLQLDVIRQAVARRPVAQVERDIVASCLAECEQAVVYDRLFEVVGV